MKKWSGVRAIIFHVCFRTGDCNSECPSKNILIVLWSLACLTLFFLEFQASPCFIRSPFIDQACGHVGYMELNLFPSMKLRSNRHTAVVHHKLSGFASIELQEIVLSTMWQSSLSVQCFSLLLLQTACFSLRSIQTSYRNVQFAKSYCSSCAWNFFFTIY